MTTELPPQYTYEGRLASFKKAAGPKRRGSAVKGTKVGNSWPHSRYLSAEQLAGAGFFWSPSPEYPDNVCCFLCHKNLRGWEHGDDALREHIIHAPECGWAVVAAIAAGHGDYAMMDPGDATMVEARKATFAGMWPHENKRGWKCKVKQLAEAGWKWTPTIDYDDMATCVYCDLMLDGWEQADKPLDEHKKRSPDCPFFVLMDEFKPLRKAKGKGARNSKVSRVSVQSVSMADTNITTLAEEHAEYDDTAMTTASTATTRKGRPKKAPAASKSRKTKVKKDEPVEVDSDKIAEEEMPPPPPPKPTRGRKRASDVLEDSIATMNSEAPTTKKRAIKGRNTQSMQSVQSVQSMQSTESTENWVIEESTMELDEPHPRRPGRPSNGRKASAASGRSNASTITHQTAPGAFPDDEEIDRQLEADLERPLTDDEDIMHDSDSERHKTASVRKNVTTVKRQSLKDVTRSEGSKVWLDENHEVDDAEVEEDLERLEQQLAAEQAAAAAEEERVVPKKGRKTGGTRKASKQTKAQKAKEAEEAASRAVDEAAERQRQEEHDLAEAEAREHESERNQHDADEEEEEMSLVPEPSPAKAEDISTGTVERYSLQHLESQGRTSTGRKRGRPSKADLAACLSAQQTELRQSKVAEAQREVAAGDARETVEPASFVSAHESPEPAEPTPPRREESPPPATSPLATSPVPPSSVLRSAHHFPSTPRAQASPAQSARQAVVSPSPSPQASDAENQPPSCRPPATQKRVVLAPVAATPARMGSPSKRNVLAGLHSTTPWTAVDVDMVFEGDKENGIEGFVAKGSELSSPERRMTVEQWIYYNAERAEARLKHECEALVSQFESEGSKAMNVLEGIIVD